MAEFSEVMRQWRRMCKHSDCESCEIIDKHAVHPCDKSMDELSEDDLQQIERIVMRWAAEHPKPGYPTWGEWLESMWDVNEHNSFGDFVYRTPIPADIAQKLGIEPKEGQHESDDNGDTGALLKKNWHGKGPYRLRQMIKALWRLPMWKRWVDDHDAR